MRQADVLSIFPALLANNNTAIEILKSIVAAVDESIAIQADNANSEDSDDDEEIVDDVFELRMVAIKTLAKFLLLGRLQSVSMIQKQVRYI